MKKLLLNSIVAGAALLASVNASAQSTEKFYLGVTGYPTSTVDKENPVTVDATVYSDYSFVVGLPSKTAQVNANNATIDIKMTDVASLGVSGTRSISKTITTGITSTTVTLSDWLKNCYGFAGVTCPVTIIDGSDSQTFTYNIGGIAEQTDGTYTITGKPDSSTDAATAWQMITNNVTTGTLTESDTYVTIPAGTYIQLGNEKLLFEKGYSYLQGSWSLESEMQAVKDNATLYTLSDVTGTESAKCIIYLPNGTTLALGSSYATLDKDATITIDASAAADENTTFTGYLSALKTAANDADAPLYQTLYSAVQLFDKIVGLVDTANEVPITVQFVEKEKFYFGVTGYTGSGDSEVASTVDFTVYGDYSFVAKLPVSGSKVDADKADVYSYMQNVPSLGVEYRSFEKTIETGIGVTGLELDTYLSKAYAFKGATCPVTVIDGDKSQSFTYSISEAIEQSDGTYTITGTPSSTTDASTAWYMITANVTSGIYETDNAGYLDMKAGAFLQLGDERAMFTKDFKLLSDTWDSSNLSVRTYTVEDNDTYRCVIYFPVGCQITMDDSYATLNKPVAVIVDGTSYKDGDAITKWISTLTGSSTANAVLNLVDMFNTIVGLVDSADEVPITVMFNPVLVDIFKTNGYAVLGMEMDALTDLQDIENNDNPDPNAVAQLICGALPEDAINLVYDSVNEVYTGYPNDNNVCDDFVVTDKYPVNIPEDIGGFTATKASYSRENTSFTNKGTLQSGTICLPFPVTTTSDVQFYEFSDINLTDSLMTFKGVSTIAANTPAAYSVNQIGGTVEVTETDVTVPATEAKDYTTNSMTFTGVQKATVTLTAEGKTSNKYYITQNKFWRATKNDVTVYPQRAYFIGPESTTGEVKSFSISFDSGDDDDTTTGITAIQNADNAVVDIYSINGVRQSGLQKGVNIVRYANGQTRKVIVK